MDLHLTRTRGRAESRTIARHQKTAENPPQQVAVLCTVYGGAGGDGEGGIKAIRGGRGVGKLTPFRLRCIQLGCGGAVG